MAFGQQVGIGVAGSYWATISAVAKCNRPNAPYCIPNEWIAVEIGRFLGLRFRPPGSCTAAGEPVDWFASLDFNLTERRFLPSIRSAVPPSFPALSTGLLLFDILVANCDRHRQNFSVDFSRILPR